MKNFPHRYAVTATANEQGSIALTATGLPELTSMPPIEFNGPGDQWSPETLLVAAVADCLVLSFRGIARASKLSWENLECKADGILEKIESRILFTEIVVHATLWIPNANDRDKAQRLLEKAEKDCLITNSLNSDIILDVTVNTIE
ncbi:MAG: OsmC family protein [Gammaproteobacteria bacterium]|nr:OsmC family protein [Gammaproteobacteria bacterium]